MSLTTDEKYNEFDISSIELTDETVLPALVC